MKNKLFLVLLILSSFILPCPSFADAPPPPPITADFTYEGQKITDQNFSAVILECGERETDTIPQLNIIQYDPEKNCSWKPAIAAYNCSNSTCEFNWTLGDFKFAVYIPSLDKTFVSDILTRKYEGYYGRKTQRIYEVKLSKDNKVDVSSFIGMSDRQSSNWFGMWMLLSGFLATLMLEAIVVTIFVLTKKIPKRIFGGLALGNMISVPLVWIPYIIYPLAWMLFSVEIIAVVFEAWILKLFSQKTLSWKLVLLISFLMNVVSFVIGPILMSF